MALDGIESLQLAPAILSPVTHLIRPDSISMVHSHFRFLETLRRSLLHRLVVLFILAGVVPALLVGGVAHHHAKVALDSAHDLARESLVHSVERQLESVRDNQKVGIERYFQTIVDQVVTFSSDPTVVQAADQFREAFSTFRSESAWDDGRARAATRSVADFYVCLLYTSPSPRDRTRSRMPSSA